MIKETDRKHNLESKSNVTSINKVVINSDGFLQIPSTYLRKQNGTVEGLMFQTDYGYKIISLVPDAKKIYVEVTTLCNFDCTTCIRNSWEDQLGHMDVGIFEKLLEQIKELPQLESIHFGGFGEPMSHPHIFDMISSVKALGLKAEMITNGSLLTEESAGRLIELGLDKLFISLDGPDEEVFNDIRQGADYNTVISNIKTFNSIKNARKTHLPELAFEFVAMKKNIDKLPKVARLVDELNARYLLVTNVLPYCDDLKDQIVYDLDDTVPMFGTESLLTMLRAKLPHMKLRTERFCGFVENKALTVTRDGNVSPCYALMHSYKSYIYGREKKIKPYHMGNIKERTVRDIWINPEYACFRATVKEFKFPSCTDCKHLDGCSYTDDNEMDCWGNSPSCAECLWARGLIVCP